MPLPFARSLDSSTDATRGALFFSQSRSSWTPGDPDSEALLRVLLTDIGTHVPDPSFGFNYGVLQKRATNSEQTIRSECERAIARVVKQRGLQEVQIVVQIEGQVVAITINYKTRSGRSGQQVSVST